MLFVKWRAAVMAARCHILPALAIAHDFVIDAAPPMAAERSAPGTPSKAPFESFDKTGDEQDGQCGNGRRFE
jgi:hypothetical protein